MVEAGNDIAQQLVTPLVKIGTDDAQLTQQGKPFPLVLSPADGEMNFVQLQEYFMANNEKIRQAASEYGAVMFSGFDIKTGEEWASVLYKSGLKQMEYVGGAAVRNLIVGNDQRMKDMQILTTNESPASEPIPFHHELAQTPNPPDHICFYCSVNDAEGGSTPLIRSDMVYDYLLGKYPDFVTKIEELGVKYRKVAPEENDPSSALGRSWKAMYNVETKEDAEREAAKQGSTLEWRENGDVRVISQKLPAIRVSSNGNKTFFNQIIAAYTGWIDSRNNPKEAVVFGDDTALPSEILDDLSEYMTANKCAYRWSPGKFVIVDNTVAYHSRQPFAGRRKVFAAIGKGSKPVTDNTTHLVLNSGDKLPMLGLGLWKLGGDICADIVYNAIKNGYRMLDSACDYGNEEKTGQGIKKAIDEGVCTREDLFVVSKLWNTFHRPEHVKLACQKSMADLGVDYLDLYLIHFPIHQPFVPIETTYPPEWTRSVDGAQKMELDTGVTYQQTWEAMEQLVRDGLVRNIGFCNIGTNQIQEVLNYAKVKPAVLQVELHPYLTQEKLIRKARENGIQVMAFSNLASSSYVELSMAGADDSPLVLPQVTEIAARHSKTPAQVLLRWAVQRGTAAIPKSSKVERLIENISIFDFNLSHAEMASISSLNKHRRFNDPGVFAEAAFGTFCPIYD